MAPVLPKGQAGFDVPQTVRLRPKFDAGQYGVHETGELPVLRQEPGARGVRMQAHRANGEEEKT